MTQHSLFANSVDTRIRTTEKSYHTEDKMSWGELAILLVYLTAMERMC
jgi:hypothetical protein